MACKYYLQCEYRKNTLPGILEISFHTYEAIGDSRRRTCIIDSGDLKADIEGIFQSGAAAYPVQWGLVHLVSAEFYPECALVRIQENGMSSISYFRVCRDNLSKGILSKKR